MEKLLEEMAAKEGTTPEFIRKSMQEAIDAGFDNPDPAVRSVWKEIPFSGSRPELEDVLAYCLSVWIVEELQNAAEDLFV